MIKIKKFNWDRLNRSALPHNVKANLLRVDVLAKKNGWDILMFHANNYIVNLSRDGVKMNIYLSTLTVQTAMHHPVQGKTQLNRKNLTLKQVEQLFTNPREHTGKGYYKQSN